MRTIAASDDRRVALSPGESSSGWGSFLPRLSLGDWISAGVVFLVAAAVYPDTKSSTVTGSAIDMITADGPCFAIQQVGEFDADSLAGVIQESAPGLNDEQAACLAGVPLDAFADVREWTPRDWAAHPRLAAALAPVGLAVREPSLDDVFLSLPGHRTATDDRPDDAESRQRGAA